MECMTHQRKTETCSPRLTRTRCFYPIEPFKNVRLCLLGNPHARITHSYQEERSALLKAHRHGTARTIITQSILQEVAKDDSQQLFIARHTYRKFGIACQLHLPGFCHAVQFLNHLWKEGKQSHFLQHHCVVFHCQHEQGCNQVFQAPQGAFPDHHERLILLQRRLWVSDNNLQIGSEDCQRRSQLMSSIGHKTTLLCKCLL